MSSGNSSEPRTPDWREQHRTDIRRRLEGIIQEAAIEEAARNSSRAGEPTTDLHTEDEVNDRTWLEASKKERLDLCFEVAEIMGLSRASISQRLNESGSPEGPVSAAGEAIHQQIGLENDSGFDAGDEFEAKSSESDEINSSDEDNEAVAPDNPSATVPQTRYISKKDMDEQGLWGVGIYKKLYRSESTDALYFLSDLGEEIWLIDDNGDCVLAQDQALQQAARSSPEPRP